MSEKANLFLKLDTFKNFYSEEVEIISEYFSIHKFFDLQEIMPQKGEDTSFGIILNGEVSIMDDRLDNPSRTSGDFLGEMALIQSTPRTTEFIAASDGMIAIMTFDDIENLKLKRPYLAVKLIHLATQKLVEFMRNTVGKTTQDTIVLIADDSKKKDLIQLINHQSEIWLNYSILAPHDLARIIQQKTTITKVISINPNLLVGSFETIGAQIILGKIKALICLREPLVRKSSRSALEAIYRLCDTYDVIYATNFATAQSILNSLM